MSERGQASVELVASVPALLLLALALFQLLAVGYAAVLAGNAAEAGALAVARGADFRAAARKAVPGWSRAGMTVSRSGDSVRVGMKPPSPLTSVADRLEVHATAAVAGP
jgi:Flp pilus assembly protein TadG